MWWPKSKRKERAAKSASPSCMSLDLVAHVSKAARLFLGGRISLICGRTFSARRKGSYEVLTQHFSPPPLNRYLDYLRAEPTSFSKLALRVYEVLSFSFSPGCLQVDCKASATERKYLQEQRNSSAKVGFKAPPRVGSRLHDHACMIVVSPVFVRPNNGSTAASFDSNLARLDCSVNHRTFCCECIRNPSPTPSLHSVFESDPSGAY